VASVAKHVELGVEGRVLGLVEPKYLVENLSRGQKLKTSGFSNDLIEA